jgi:hypothetical protein
MNPGPVGPRRREHGGMERNRPHNRSLVFSSRGWFGKASTSCRYVLLSSVDWCMIWCIAAAIIRLTRLTRQEFAGFGRNPPFGAGGSVLYSHRSYSAANGGRSGGACFVSLAHPPLPAAVRSHAIIRTQRANLPKTESYAILLCDIVDSSSTDLSEEPAGYQRDHYNLRVLPHPMSRFCVDLLQHSATATCRKNIPNWRR